MSQLLFTAACFLVAATSGQSALLNCSAFVSPRLPVHAPSSLPRAPFLRIDDSNRDSEEVVRRFYEPRLHACFQANPYDTSQLPLDVDTLFDAFDVRYRFALDRLQADSVSADVLVTGSLYFWWHDAHRSWNQSEIQLNTIFVPATELWTPALRVVHPLNADIELAVDPASTARVSHDGSIRVAYRQQFTAHCTRNLSEFPSDPQNCSLLFVLRNHPSADIRIANTSAPYNASDPSIKSDSFRVLSIWDYPHEFEVPEEGHLPGFVLSIDMQRYPDFYIYNIIIPVIMLTAINIFTMFPEPSDRLNVAAMVILGYPVLQNLVADTIPHSDDPPPIAGYIAGSFMLAALNLLFCALLCFYERQPDAALSRLFSAPLCYPVHCGLTSATRVMEKIEEERRTLLESNSRDAARRAARSRRRLLTGARNGDRGSQAYGATQVEGDGIARSATAPTVLVCGGINYNSASTGYQMSHDARGGSQSESEAVAEAEGEGGNALGRSDSVLRVRRATPRPRSNELGGQEGGEGEAASEMPTESELAKRRHLYSFFALKFILGMAHFGLTVWLIMKYKVWGLLMAAMYEVPVFGWSLMVFAVASTYLYVFENTIWPWYNDLRCHWFSCCRRRTRSSGSIVAQPSEQPPP